MRTKFIWAGLACAGLFTGCLSDNSLNVSESTETTYISVEIPGYSNQSRVSYDDLKLAFYWESEDQLEIVTKSKRTFTGTLIEGEGKDRATFEVPARSIRRSSYAYYKAANLTVDENGEITMDYSNDNIQQDKDNPTAHIKKNLFLRSKENIYQNNSEQDIQMEMLNSIFCFDIQSLPDQVKNITYVEWIANYGSEEEKKTKIRLPDGQVPSSLYMCFDPNRMKLEAGQKFALKFYEDKDQAHVVYATSEEGNEYLAGNRYYATVGKANSGANLSTWENSGIVDGKIHVTEDMYTSQNLAEVLADESQENLGQISISTAQPISVSLTEKGELKITNYAPVPAEKIKVFCKIQGVNTEAFELAEYDKLYGYSQSVMPLPFMSQNVRMITKNGKAVEIPAQHDLKNEDCTFQIEMDSPTGSFWEKISHTPRPLTIAFSSLDDKGAWKPLSPTDCRRAVVIGMTMSYMFNHPDYEQHVRDWNTTGYIGKELKLVWPFMTIVYMPSSPFRDEVPGNQGFRPVDSEEVLDRLYNRKRMEWSDLYQGFDAAGLAILGGDRLGFKKSTYELMCNWENLQEMNPNKVDESKCKVVDRIFHEFAHNMGYKHDYLTDHKGTMTYGGGWPTCNYVFLRDRLYNRQEMLLPLDGKWAERTDFPANLMK